MIRIYKWLQECDVRCHKELKLIARDLHTFISPHKRRIPLLLRSCSYKSNTSAERFVCFYDDSHSFAMTFNCSFFISVFQSFSLFVSILFIEDTTWYSFCCLRPVGESVFNANDKPYGISNTHLNGKLSHLRLISIIRHTSKKNTNMNGNFRLFAKFGADTHTHTQKKTKHLWFYLFDDSKRHCINEHWYDRTAREHAGLRSLALCWITVRNANTKFRMGATCLMDWCVTRRLRYAVCT